MSAVFNTIQLLSEKNCLFSNRLSQQCTKHDRKMNLTNLSCQMFSVELVTSLQCSELHWKMTEFSEVDVVYCDWTEVCSFTEVLWTLNLPERKLSSFNLMIIYILLQSAVNETTFKSKNAECAVFRTTFEISSTLSKNNQNSSILFIVSWDSIRELN